MIADPQKMAAFDSPLAGSRFHLDFARTFIPGLVAIALISSLPGCKKPTSSLPSKPCGSGSLFQILPFDPAVISYVGPIGILAPIGRSPLPKAHTGFMMTTPGTPQPFLAPADLTITEFRRTRYITSPTRPGHEDYSLSYSVCDDVKGHFGHLSNVDPSLVPTSTFRCTTYSTVDETVESCIAQTTTAVSQGRQLATSGTHPSAPAVDIGLTDARVSDGYVNPARYGKVGQPGVLCPWEAFAEGPKAILLAKIGLNPTQLTTETPKCGSVAIDRDGTAAGRWTLQAAPADGTSPTAGDFAVFTPDPYHPQTRVALSTRIATFVESGYYGAFQFPTQASGRVNVLPSSIGVDGQIYCYVEDLTTSTFSFLVKMTAARALKVEKVLHPAGSTPCGQNPASWTLSGAAVALIR